MGPDPDPQHCILRSEKENPRVCALFFTKFSILIFFRAGRPLDVGPERKPIAHAHEAGAQS